MNGKKAKKIRKLVQQVKADLAKQGLELPKEVNQKLFKRDYYNLNQVQRSKI